MIKVKLENVLLQVRQEKKTDSHPCLDYLSKRLCYICLALDSVVGDDDDDDNDVKIKRLNKKYLACCEIYKEFKKSKIL